MALVLKIDSYSENANVDFLQSLANPAVWYFSQNTARNMIIRTDLLKGHPLTLYCFINLPLGEPLTEKYHTKFYILHTLKLLHASDLIPYSPSCRVQGFVFSQWQSQTVVRREGKCRALANQPILYT